MGRRRTKRRTRRTRRRRQRGGKPPAYVFGFSGRAGFGSVTNVMIHAIKYAKDQGRDFYLRDEDWGDGPMKRWHDGFKTLTTYDPKKHGEEKNDGGHPKYDGMRGYALSELTPIVKDILALKDDLAKKAKDFTDSIGGPYTSVYVRRGDKVNGCAIAPKEMEAMPADQILKECEMKDDGRKIFVMSDDYTVVDELKKALPSCKIFTLTPETNRGLAQDMMSRFTPEERKLQSEELVTSIQVFLNGEKAYSDNRSNLGRLLKVAKPDIVHLYPVTDHSKGLKPDTPIWPSWRELGMKLEMGGGSNISRSSGSVNKMKVALYLSGHLRNLKDTMRNYRRVFSSPNVEFDFYFTLWKVNHVTDSDSWKHNKETQKTLVDIQPVTEQDVYAICPEAKKVVLLDEHTLPPEYAKIKPAIAQQSYGTYMAFLQLPDTYDLYVRLRTDLYFFKGIDWEYLRQQKATYNLFIPEKVHRTTPNYPASRMFDDIFWISTYPVGKFISELYLNLPKMNAGKCTEEYYADYLDREKFSILKYPFDVVIERRTRGFNANLDETPVYTARRKAEGDFV